jgi:hypothetical protein
MTTEQDRLKALVQATANLYQHAKTQQRIDILARQAETERQQLESRMTMGETSPEDET